MPTDEQDPNLPPWAASYLDAFEALTSAEDDDTAAEASVQMFEIAQSNGATGVQVRDVLARRPA